ncbi:CLUMA_CG007452, isoform A [Clunio marinus]|uniref:CLUMA_CG007452, isoform A n=1 Tax=Clunio marinus TaxID=568069 RepID=A0A1J1I0X3_9DIPT|nr:CLUMA_CG007452, isoform A [Clunio marinus]
MKRYLILPCPENNARFFLLSDAMSKLEILNLSNKKTKKEISMKIVIKEQKVKLFILVRLDISQQRFLSGKEEKDFLSSNLSEGGCKEKDLVFKKMWCTREDLRVKDFFPTFSFFLFHLASDRVRVNIKTYNVCDEMKFLTQIAQFIAKLAAD